MISFPHFNVWFDSFLRLAFHYPRKPCHPRSLPGVHSLMPLPALIGPLSRVGSSQAHQLLPGSVSNHISTKRGSALIPSVTPLLQPLEELSVLIDPILSLTVLSHMWNWELFQEFTHFSISLKRARLTSDFFQLSHQKAPLVISFPHFNVWFDLFLCPTFYYPK